MFRVKPQSIGEILSQLVRDEGLETPLLQKRVIDAWDEVAGPLAARHTEEKYIRNQTLFVRINLPALRTDLAMRRSQIKDRLNEKVGSFVIAELRIL